MDGLPLVNINGTSCRALIESRMNAREAIQNAMKALSDCAPNGRDYQTAKPGEYDTARALYVARFSFLDQLANDLQDEAVAIQDQGSN